MKKFITALTLSALSFSVFAATTATLNLKGNIQEKMSIEVQEDSAALLLDLTVEHSDSKIAEVVEKSNRQAGYKVSISSANGSKLKNGSLDEVDYTLSYAGQALDLSGAGDEVEYANQRALGNGEVRDIGISFDAQVEEDLVAGDYTDTITFVISAN